MRYSLPGPNKAPTIQNRRRLIEDHSARLHSIVHYTWTYVNEILWFYNAWERCLHSQSLCIDVIRISSKRIGGKVQANIAVYHDLMLISEVII